MSNYDKEVDTAYLIKLGSLYLHEFIEHKEIVAFTSNRERAFRVEASMFKDMHGLMEYMYKRLELLKGLGFNTNIVKETKTVVVTVSEVYIDSDYNADNINICQDFELSENEKTQFKERNINEDGESHGTEE